MILSLKACFKKQLATKDIIKYELICDITRTEEVYSECVIAESKLNT